MAKRKPRAFRLGELVAFDLGGPDSIFIAEVTSVSGGAITVQGAGRIWPSQYYLVSKPPPGTIVSRERAPIRGVMMAQGKKGLRIIRK